MKRLKVLFLSIILFISFSSGIIQADTGYLGQDLSLLEDSNALIDIYIMTIERGDEKSEKI